MSHAHTERCKQQTNELLKTKRSALLASLRSPRRHNDDLLVALHTEMRYADPTRKYLLQNVLKRLEEVNKLEEDYRRKQENLAYQIRQALEEGN